MTPFIDRPREFTWRRTYIGTDGQIHDEVLTSNRIDLRESVFNFLRCEVFTKGLHHLHLVFTVLTIFCRCKSLLINYVCTLIFS